MPLPDNAVSVGIIRIQRGFAFGLIFYCILSQVRVDFSE